MAPSKVKGERMGLAAVGGREKPLLNALSWLKLLADVRRY